MGGLFSGLDWFDQQPWQQSIGLLAVAINGFVVFVERGQRKILVNYAKRQVGNKVYGWSDQPLAVEAEHGRCHSGDFRVQRSSCSRLRLGTGLQR